MNLRFATEYDGFWRAFGNGFDDRDRYGLARKEQVYRRPSLRLGWRLGWELAHLVTCTPLRYTRRPWP